jgi:hypothetical protein
VKPSPLGGSRLTPSRAILTTVAPYEGAKREFRDFGASRGDRELAVSKPWHSAVAVTLGQFIVIPRW